MSNQPGNLEQPAQHSEAAGTIARFFQFDSLQTDLKTEILAGVTTFVTIAYILIVNPAILSDAVFLSEPGDLFGELVMATGLAAAIATLIMGLYARLPFALAPGMGINAFFAYTVVLGMGVADVSKLCMASANGLCRNNKPVARLTEDSWNRNQIEIFLIIVGLFLGYGSNAKIHSH